MLQGFVIMLVNMVPLGVGIGFALARVLAAIKCLVVSVCMVWR